MLNVEYFKNSSLADRRGIWLTHSEKIDGSVFIWTQMMKLCLWKISVLQNGLQECVRPRIRISSKIRSLVRMNWSSLGDRARISYRSAAAKCLYAAKEEI